jgi:hypothetical protein
VEKKTVIIAGSLAQKPRTGGHTWQFLQYLLGFRRLGWEVLFLDRLEPDMCVDVHGQPTPLEQSVNLQYFLDVMQRFGLQECYSLDFARGKQVIGRPRPQVLETVRRGAFLLNVMGFLEDQDILGAARRRVFLDTDPGFGQMWCDLGLANLFTGHDQYVTIAENIGQSDCTIPTCGLKWTTWRQPIVLDQWPAQPPVDGAYTSIGAWRGPYGPVEFKGKIYGLRVHEFRKFVTLARLAGRRFEVALDIHAAETKDLDALASNGWSVADPRQVACDPPRYRSYIQGSRGEFMATKGMYVDTRSGWFSERSICYLASGRPVLAQDTGLKNLYPVGEGLLTFTTLDEAVASIEAIERNYSRHARAARALAETHFDSDRVLSDLLMKVVH